METVSAIRSSRTASVPSSSAKPSAAAASLPRLQARSKTLARDLDRPVLGDLAHVLRGELRDVGGLEQAQRLAEGRLGQLLLEAAQLVSQAFTQRVGQGGVSEAQDENRRWPRIPL
jgi:hypothetical protein